MIDYFAIGLTHLLMAHAAWRLVMRDGLDHEVKPDGDPKEPGGA